MTPDSVTGSAAHPPTCCEGHFYAGVGQCEQRRFVGDAEVRKAMQRSPSNPCFAGGTVVGGTFAPPDGVVIVIERPDGRVLRVNGTVLDA